VPSIEAWYLAGKNHQVGEAAWKVGMSTGHFPFTKKELKQQVYETDRPSLDWETQRAVEAAERIVNDSVARIEMAFPVGIGIMSREIRTWAK